MEEAEEGRSAFGDFVQQCRSNTGMSIRAAASLAGISEGRWRQVEKGYQSVGGGLRVPVKPSERLVERIADALSLERDEMLDRAGYPEAAERWRQRVTAENSEPQVQVNGGSVGGHEKGREPYLSRREGPNLSDVSTDALLEEIAKRARSNNPDATR